MDKIGFLSTHVLNTSTYPQIYSACSVRYLTARNAIPINQINVKIQSLNHLPLSNQLIRSHLLQSMKHLQLSHQIDYFALFCYASQLSVYFILCSYSLFILYFTPKKSDSHSVSMNHSNQPCHCLSSVF